MFRSAPPSRSAPPTRSATPPVLLLPPALPLLLVPLLPPVLSFSPTLPLPLVPPLPPALPFPPVLQLIGARPLLLVHLILYLPLPYPVILPDRVLPPRPTLRSLSHSIPPANSSSYHLPQYSYSERNARIAVAERPPSKKN